MNIEGIKNSKLGENEKNKIINHINSVADAEYLAKMTDERKTFEKMWNFVSERAKEKAINGTACIDESTVYAWIDEYIGREEKDEPKPEPNPQPKPETKNKANKKTSRKVAIEKKETEIKEDIPSQKVELSEEEEIYCADEDNDSNSESKDEDAPYIADTDEDAPYIADTDEDAPYIADTDEDEKEEENKEKHQDKGNVKEKEFIQDLFNF